MTEDRFKWLLTDFYFNYFSNECVSSKTILSNSDVWKLPDKRNIKVSRIECTLEQQVRVHYGRDPAWRARSAIANWQVDSEIRTHRPGSRKLIQILKVV